MDFLSIRKVLFCQEHCQQQDEDVGPNRPSRVNISAILRLRGIFEEFFHQTEIRNFILSSADRRTVKAFLNMYRASEYAPMKNKKVSISLE